MELTLKISEELESRLRAQDAEVSEILERGLEALKASGPSSEDLVDYAAQRLDPARSEALAERLADDPQAVEDLQDLQRFESLEPPTPAHRLDDDDVARAKDRLWRRWDAESAEAASEDVVEAAPSELAPIEVSESPRRASADPVTVPSTRVSTFPKPSNGSRFSLVRPLAVAAGLVLAVALGAGFGSIERPRAQNAHLVKLGSTRSTAVQYMVPASAEVVYLIVDGSGLRAGQKGRLVVRGQDAEVLFERRVQGSADPQSMLIVSLPSDRLPSGRYRLEILDAASGEELTHRLFVLQRSP